MNLQTALEPYHILHVETLDGDRRHWPLDTSWIAPLIFQLDLANRCCAKSLYAIRVIPKPIPATGAEVISITDHDVIKSPGDW